MAAIKTIGVCGAGVMGAQLAAFLGSAGFDVLLFDLDQKLSEKGLEGDKNAKPPAFYHLRFAKRVTPCSYDADLDRIGTCDWVLEAIAERLDWKQDLYRKLAPRMKDGAILSSNTSGLSLATLAEALPEGLRERFLITHFFNPPRYMRLVELVTGPETRDDVRAAMHAFIGEILGKGVVDARDTPNFIANRIGIFGMMLALKITREMRLGIEQVDAVTGPVMGRPKSATYRVADLVGLDTLAFVAQTSYEQCPDDESRDLFALPDVLKTLLERKNLGLKTGAGFYRKEGKNVLALDFQTMDYRPSTKPRMDGITVARRYTDLEKKLQALIYNPDPAGELAWELTIGTLSYAARRVGEIAADVVSVDRAMKWGYAWQLGPFETWDAIGVEKSVQRMEGEGKDVPPIVRKLLERGQTSFYDRNGDGHRRFFDVCGTMKTVPVDDGVVVLADEKARRGELAGNWSASLVDIGDGVACFELHSALQPEFNPIDGAVIDLLDRTVDVVRERGFKGLVISHEGVHFCAGANLAMILELARAGNFAGVETASKTMQDATQKIKYAPFPVVAAPFNVCLGGGFEMIAPCDRVLPLAELYCGAVEVGVGLIPGAGGNLRLLTHLAERFPTKKHGPVVLSQKAFEVIGFAKVSGSAHEAIELGYLRENAEIVLSRDHQIARAKAEVLRLAEGYAAPEPTELNLPGSGGRLAIYSGIDSFVKAGTISEHDALIGKKLANVLTGGDRANAIVPVDEQYLLDLEREAFVSLAGEPKSQARMEFMLKKGKPLRN